MLKKDRSEIYLSFDVNGKHLLTIWRTSLPCEKQRRAASSAWYPRGEPKIRTVSSITSSTWIQWPRARWSGWSNPFLYLPVSKRPISFERRARRRVRAHQECVLRAVKQHVVSLLASRADPPADRSRRSIWHDQGDDQGFKVEKERSRDYA